MAAATGSWLAKFVRVLSAPPTSNRRAQSSYNDNDNSIVKRTQENKDKAADAEGNTVAVNDDDNDNDYNDWD